MGFVTEDGTPVVNQVSTGASAIFPQGLVHYQQNLDCYQATYTISYNSEDPGTQVRSMANPTAIPQPHRLCPACTSAASRTPSVMCSTTCASGSARSLNGR